jgi:DNA modification methylase
MAVSFLETGVLYCEDNLRQLAQFPAECVDLIYLDPPFFSNRVYEVIWGDEAEVRSFEDRWEGGIQLYVGWMRDRVMQMFRVLRSGGALYLHCDSHASHYLKVMLDDVFTPAGFVNEIVWLRHNARTVKQAIWPRLHDTLLYYSKGKPATFNATVVPSTAEKHPHDLVPGPDGRRYRTFDLTGAGLCKGRDDRVQRTTGLPA